MARCSVCHNLGHVLIDRQGNIVHTLAEAVMMIPCTAGCASQEGQSVPEEELPEAG